MNVIGRFSRSAASATRSRRLAASSLSACSSATTTPGAATADAPSIAELCCAYTQTSRAPCRLASPAAYAAARREVTESSTPTRMTLGPSVPSSNSPASATSPSSHRVALRWAGAGPRGDSAGRAGTCRRAAARLEQHTAGLLGGGGLAGHVAQRSEDLLRGGAGHLGAVLAHAALERGDGGGADAPESAAESAAPEAGRRVLLAILECGGVRAAGERTRAPGERAGRVGPRCAGGERPGGAGRERPRSAAEPSWLNLHAMRLQAGLERGQ